MKTHELVKEYISRNQERYRAGKKGQKKLILDEFCLTCGVTRKWAIRLLGRDLKALRRVAGRKIRYDARLVQHLTVLWHSITIKDRFTRRIVAIQAHGLRGHDDHQS